MRRATRLLAPALTALTLVPSSAGATTFYAKGDSTRQTTPCTEQLPCKLDYALGQMASGADETIALSSGGTLTHASMNVITHGTIRGQATGERPTIAGQPLNMLKISAGSDTPTVRHLRLTGTPGSTALLLRGGSLGEDLIVAVTGTDASGVRLQDTGSNVLRDATVVADGARAIGVYTAAGTAAAPDHVVNVTAIATGTESIGVRQYAMTFSLGGNNCTYAAAYADVRNTIARGASADLAGTVSEPGGCSGHSQTHMQVDHSNFVTTATTANAEIVKGEGNQTTAAETDLAAIFADSAHHQRATAPTLDAGSATGGVGTADPDGDARVLGPAPDIGADEAPAAPAVTTGTGSYNGTSATFTGTVTPGPLAGKVVFEWGTTTAYGSATAEQDVAAGAGATPFSATVTNIPEGTTLHFRIRATVANALQSRTAAGADQSVLVPFFPAVPPPGGGGPTTLPALLSGFKVPSSATRARLFRGIVTRFSAGARASVVATLTVPRGKRRVTLAKVTRTGVPAGPVTLTLKPKRATVRSLYRRYLGRSLPAARVTLTISAPGYAPVTKRASVKLKRQISGRDLP